MEDRVDERRLRRVVRRKDGHVYGGVGKTVFDGWIRDGLIRKPFALSPGGKARAWYEDELAADLAALRELAAAPVGSKQGGGR
jgi:hypothetical protein